MLRKTLIATAAAGMLAAGSLVATTASASSSGPSIHFGGPGWNVQIGGGFHPGYRNQYPRQHCRPIVKTVKSWKWGKPHWQQVVVGYDCKRRLPPKPKYPHYPNYPNFPGYWGW